jgi:type IV secretory pathway TraG/TraD family ATPase VirD4
MRCAAWDLWRECLTQPDFDNVSNTLIPMGTKEDPFWQGSGRTIFAEAAYLMRNDKDRSYSKLVDTLLSIKIEKLRSYLKNSPAANLVEEKIEKTAISIRAVLTNYVKAIRYLQGIENNGESFTIRDWMRGVREDGKNGWLFISSNADTHASLKPVISMWLSIAIRGLLAMGKTVTAACGSSPTSCLPCTSCRTWLRSCRRRVSLAAATSLAFSPTPSWKIFTGRSRRKRCSTC